MASDEVRSHGIEGIEGIEGRIWDSSAAFIYLKHTHTFNKKAVQSG